MSGPDMLPLDRLTITTFEAQLHSVFEVVDTLELELIGARSLGRAYVEGHRAPFALTFVGAPERLLPQSTYRLRHEALGMLELFLVPIGPDAQGRMRYEAVFT